MSPIDDGLSQLAPKDKTFRAQNEFIRGNRVVVIALEMELNGIEESSLSSCAENADKNLKFGRRSSHLLAASQSRSQIGLPENERCVERLVSLSRSKSNLSLSMRLGCTSKVVFNELSGYFMVTY